MKPLSMPDILKRANVGWTTCTLKTNGPRILTHDEGLAEFFEGFELEIALATCRSGIDVLTRGQRPDIQTLGPVLYLEGYAGNETRILRHLSGTQWQLISLIEETGENHACERVTQLGAGESGDGDVSQLTYHQYWELSEEGAWSAIAARLVEVQLVAPKPGEQK